MARKKAEQPPLRIATADTLDALIIAPLIARFTLDGRTIEIPCRRLSPREDEQIVAQERSARPKRIATAPNAMVEYDTVSEEYHLRRQLAEKTARAMAVYMGCALVSGRKPGLTTPKEIYDHVQGTWTEWIIEIIGQTVRVGGVSVSSAEVNDAANFTTPPDSVQS